MILQITFLINKSETQYGKNNKKLFNNNIYNETEFARQKYGNDLQKSILLRFY